jgi:chemotaxis protein MotB
MKRRVFLPLVLLAAGCSGGRELRGKFELCELNTGELRGRINSDAAKISSLQSQLNDSKSQVSDLEARNKANQDRISSLIKSNQDLTSALDANREQLSRKLSDVIKEKDGQARQLAALRKDKIALERSRASLKSSRDSLSGELAALKAAAEESAAAKQAEADRIREQRRRLLARVHDDLGSVADAILKEMQSDQATAMQDGEAIVISLRENLLFKPQQAKLTDEGEALLDRLGRVLRPWGPRDVKVEGHSDNSPIKRELFGFSSRWDLSSAQATAVARYLHERAGLDARRIAASGFGEFRPIQSNNTAEGRAANRRVVLVIEPPSQIAEDRHAQK